jgi:hypothetical protein
MLLSSIIGIPQFFYNVFVFIPQVNSNNSSNSGLQIMAVLLIAVVYLLTFYITIFKTDWIIDKLQLAEGFEDDRFEFNIHRSTLLKVIIMVTGGILLIDSFPLLCKNLISYIQLINQFRKFTDSPVAGFIIIYFLKTFIGYFMLTCSRMIVNFIEFKSKKQTASVIAE